jgi:hypothetical protein
MQSGKTDVSRKPIVPKNPEKIGGRIFGAEEFLLGVLTKLEDKDSKD